MFLVLRCLLCLSLRSPIHWQAAWRSYRALTLQVLSAQSHSRGVILAFILRHSPQTHNNKSATWATLQSGILPSEGLCSWFWVWSISSRNYKYNFTSQSPSPAYLQNHVPIFCPVLQDRNKESAPGAKMVTKHPPLKHVNIYFYTWPHRNLNSNSTDLCNRGVGCISNETSASQRHIQHSPKRIKWFLSRSSGQEVVSWFTGWKNQVSATPRGQLNWTAPSANSKLQPNNDCLALWTKITS